MDPLFLRRLKMFSSRGGANSIKDVKTSLSEQEPLPGSASLTAKQVDKIIQMTVIGIGDVETDWPKRISMMKTFRSLCSDPIHHNQICSNLMSLMSPMQAAVKDLRSQVCCEACITVAHIAQQLGIKSEHFLEPMIGSLFSLLVTINAKVVSITANSTILVIYESVHSQHLLPPLHIQMQSRSPHIRRAVYSVLKVIFEHWPTSILQKQNAIVNEIMKKGLVDADSEACGLAKECLLSFRKLFPSDAAAVLDCLELLKKRQLMETLKQQEAGLLSNVAVGPGLRTNDSEDKPYVLSLPRQGTLIQQEGEFNSKSQRNKLEVETLCKWHREEMMI